MRHRFHRLRTACAVLLAFGAVAGGHIPVHAGDTVVHAPGPLGPLGGVMAGPADAASPAIVMIPGSGLSDRDGNVPHVVRAATLRMIAEGFAAHGITSLRIDKRGMFSSAAAVADANAVTVADYVTDVRAWAGVLRKRTGRDCVWLLGHSEGGLIALAAHGSVPGICGLLLLATPGRPVGTLLKAQFANRLSAAPLLEEATAALTELEAGRRVDSATLHPSLQLFFRDQVQGFLISLLALDPAALLAEYAGPAMIVQGTRDLQVFETDAARLKRAKPDAEQLILDKANHVFKTVESDDFAANIAAYGDPALPLAEGLVDRLIRFVSAHPPRVAPDQ